MVFSKMNAETESESFIVNHIKEEDFPERTRKHQEKDSFCSKLKDILQTPTAETEYDKNIQERYCVKQGVLYHSLSDQKTKWYVVVPRSMVSEILQLHHNSDLFVHPGTSQTLKFIKEFYTWKGMTTDVRKFVRACEVCSKVKTVGRTIKSDLVPRKAIAPMHTISIDLMGPYTRSKKGRRYLITAMDQFSRWTEAYPVNNADSKKVAEVLEKEFFSRFGFPKIVLTDNGSLTSHQNFGKLGVRV